MRCLYFEHKALFNWKTTELHVMYVKKKVNVIKPYVLDPTKYLDFSSSGTELSDAVKKKKAECEHSNWQAKLCSGGNLSSEIK